MCKTSSKTCGCGCGCNSINRHYLSPQEKIEKLENYLEELKKEQAGVEARIKELQDK